MSPDSSEKLRELILYIAEHSERDEDFGKTKLNKILFYADFIAYAKMGRSITGQEYQKMQFGPVPRDIEAALNYLRASEDLAIRKCDHYGCPQQRPVALRTPDLEAFTAEEIALVQQVIDDLGAMNAADVCDLSHKFIGWRVAGEGETIPYESVFVSDRELTEEEASYPLKFESAGS
jgi:uncharacterized phage-associated protein